MPKQKKMTQQDLAVVRLCRTRHFVHRDNSDIAGHKYRSVRFGCRSRHQWIALGIFKMQPAQLLVGEYVLAGFQLGRTVERSDMIMCLGRKMHGGARQCRTAT